MVSAYELRWQFTGVVLNTFEREDEALAEVRWTVNACGRATAEALSMHMLDQRGRLADVIEGRLLVEMATAAVV